jgi:N-acyl amino acid synthase of PEP-CTERM/exosortase system
MREPRTEPNDLGRRFDQLFQLTLALEDASLEEVFRIRHDVYCRDLAWEPIRADGREVDEFDRHSVHCLLSKRGTGEAVGCTRLILARPDEPGHRLPFEESCRDVLDLSVADPQRMPRTSLGEVSRLAVLRGFRRRKGEDDVPASMSEDDFATQGPEDRFPFVPVSLYLGIAAVARQLEIEHLFVLTEPRLARHFARIGFDIRPVGGSIEHHGTRIPSLLSSSKLVRELRPMLRPLYQVIAANVQQAFRAHPETPAWLTSRRAG